MQNIDSVQVSVNTGVDMDKQEAQAHNLNFFVKNKYYKLRKIIKIVATRSHFSRSYDATNSTSVGLRPRPRRESLQRSSTARSWNLSVLFLRERKKEKEKWKGKRRKRKKRRQEERQERGGKLRGR